jgi:hypothetical protein
MNDFASRENPGSENPLAEKHARVNAALTKLDLLILRGWVLEMVRDWRFGLSVGVVVLAATGTIAYVSAQVHAAGAAAMGAMIGYGLHARSGHPPGSAYRRMLEAGILQPWTGHGKSLEHWLRRRAIVLSASGSAVVAVPVIAANAKSAAPFAAMAVLGIGVSALRALSPFRGKSRKAGRGVRALLPGRSARLPMMERLARPVGRIPVWAILVSVWSLLVGCAALAVRNNADPAIGMTLIILGNLLAGGVIAFPPLGLLRFVASRPVPAYRIFSRFYGTPLATVAAASAVASFSAGLPVESAILAAALSSAVTALWLGFLVLYGMTQTPRGAVLFTIRDLAVALAIKFAVQFGALAALWLACRLLVRVAVVGRLRWRGHT